MEEILEVVYVFADSETRWLLNTEKLIQISPVWAAIVESVKTEDSQVFTLEDSIHPYIYTKFFIQLQVLKEVKSSSLATPLKIIKNSELWYAEFDADYKNAIKYLPGFSKTSTVLPITTSKVIISNLSKDKKDKKEKVKQKKTQDEERASDTDEDAMLEAHLEHTKAKKSIQQKDLKLSKTVLRMAQQLMPLASKYQCSQLLLECKRILIKYSNQLQIILEACPFYLNNLNNLNLNLNLKQKAKNYKMIKMKYTKCIDLLLQYHRHPKTVIEVLKRFSNLNQLTPFHPDEIPKDFSSIVFLYVSFLRKHIFHQNDLILFKNSKLRQLYSFLKSKNKTKWDLDEFVEFRNKVQAKKVEAIPFNYAALTLQIIDPTHDFCFDDFSLLLLVWNTFPEEFQKRIQKECQDFASDDIRKNEILDVQLARIVMGHDAKQQNKSHESSICFAPKHNLNKALNKASLNVIRMDHTNIYPIGNLSIQERKVIFEHEMPSVLQEMMMNASKIAGDFFLNLLQSTLDDPDGYDIKNLMTMNKRFRHLSKASFTLEFRRRFEEMADIQKKKTRDEFVLTDLYNSKLIQLNLRGWQQYSQFKTSQFPRYVTLSQSFSSSQSFQSCQSSLSSQSLISSNQSIDEQQFDEWFESEFPNADQRLPTDGPAIVTSS